MLSILAIHIFFVMAVAAAVVLAGAWILKAATNAVNVFKTKGKSDV